MNFDVVTFGSATIDIFAETSDSDVTHLCIDDRCEDVLAYHAGDKVLLEGVHVDIGGGGTNTAACLNKLGLRVAYAGCLGEDDHGREILGWLEQEKISFVGARSQLATNTSIILDSKKLADRTILTYKGASDDLRLEQLDVDALAATWWYFPSMLRESYQTMLALMREANARGVAVAFNPSSYQTQKGLELLREPLTRSQLFVLNREEAQMLVGVAANRAELCRRLRAAGGEIVLITEGSHGASLLYAETIYHVPSRARSVVETTGAGDCFASSFLGGLARGLSVVDALRLACVNVESLIGRVGAKAGLLSFDELRSFVDDRPVVEEPALSGKE